jgi:hypothetical protein
MQRSKARPLDFGADLNLSVADEQALIDGHQFRLASPMSKFLLSACTVYLSWMINVFLFLNNFRRIRSKWLVSPLTRTLLPPGRLS